MIIAEIGQAHDGSLGMAHSYIDALSSIGIDAIKFQMHIAEAESSIHEPFRVNFSKQDSTRWEYWRRMEFTISQWKGLKAHCEEVGLEFLCSPFSLAAVEVLEEIGVRRYKIGSGEVNNLLMLERIARTGKSIILSSGMSSFSELERTIEFLRPFGNELSLMQCTTQYPTQPETWGLNAIIELKTKYGLTTGYSDHSGDIYACLAAAALGAELFEFHAVFDRRQFGPDSTSSLSIDEIKKLVTGIRAIQKAKDNPVIKADNSQFSELKLIFEKSLAVNKNLPEGSIIRFEDLEAKKPKNQGINANEYHLVLGKKLKRDLSKWDFLNIGDIWN